jgi:ABC-type transport system involved in multi-copper enzyme maturation permease subunit
MTGKTQLIALQTLLTKEIRLSLRRERTMWVLIIYTLLMGLLGWFSLNTNSNYNNLSTNGLSSVGLSLYQLLSTVQLLLIIFIIPSFTANAVNGEKEQQTFDMLICSHLSAFSLITSKLIAGLLNTLLLIAASAPIFSLVFFFGGVSLSQVVNSLAVLIATTLLIGTLGLFYSTIFQRPAVSTAITYTSSLFWTLLPAIIFLIILSSANANLFAIYPYHSRLLLLWNPMVALGSTYHVSGIQWIYFILGLGSSSSNGTNTAIYAPYTIGNMKIDPWLAYIIISIAVTLLLFLLSIVIIKPCAISRFRRLKHNR